MSGSPKIPAEAAELAAEALRHLWWLRDAGMRETSPAPARSGPVVPAPSAPPPEPVQAAEEPTAGAPRGSAYGLADKGCGSEGLVAIRAGLGECTRCKLHAGRTRLVFGVGNPRAELMFVGEGPGADEDLQGEPFVGRAGQLLTKMIEAMGFARSEVYIANVVKCRPPGNRDPEPDEIEACEVFLKAQIATIRPRVLVALGRFAVQTLLRDTTPIGKQRGRWREYEGVKLMPTFHPAYLLRNPAEKKPAWEDLQAVMREFGKSPPGRAS
jgi:DNA polymerase